jgi:hypothetical protein
MIHAFMDNALHCFALLHICCRSADSHVRAVQYGIFFFFAAWVLVMTLYVALLLPETKGIPLVREWLCGLFFHICRGKWLTPVPMCRFPAAWPTRHHSEMQ